MMASSRTTDIATGRYVLITPARNEAALVENTIRSVIAQTVRPVRWVIVSDGSTDGTADIVKRYTTIHNWIELVSLPDRSERTFSGKVAAFNAGRERMADLDYDIIGNVDADVSFDEGYFAFLLSKLAEDPALGLVGTPYKDPLSTAHDYKFANLSSVTGPCQLFRRKCFEEIGGYLPVRGGAVDRIADIAARFKGWKTRSFPDKVYLHQRHTGTATHSVLISKFKDGGKAYSVGSSPVWELLRAVYQMTKKPFVVGACVEAFGFLWASIRRLERPVSRDLVTFCRREQRRRLNSLFGGEKLNSAISRNYFTFPFYIPRICRLLSNWPRFILNYSLRRSDATEYRMRDGIRLIDDRGALAGTLAVVFVRQEYGALAGFRTIVDIGAHVGSFAIYAAKACPDARVFCYEPEQQNFGLLTQNIDINGLRGRVSAFQCAVASNSGLRDLAVGDPLLNSFHIAPANAIRQTVNCTTLQDILTSQNLEGIDLLKINCEGSEYEILEGCSNSDLNRIANIRLEYHNLDAFDNNGEALSRFVESRGYRIERFSRYRNNSGFIWATRTKSPDTSTSRLVDWFGNRSSVRILIASIPDALISTM